MSPRYLLVLCALVLLAACPAPKLPSGPSPEYEDPPSPAWRDGGSGEPPAPSSPAVVDAGP